MTRIFQPGKLILSGEHAVVHGAPALARSLPLGIHIESSPHPLPEIRIIRPPASDLRLPLDALPARLHTYTERHRAFREGSRTIREVLPEADDFITAAAALAAPAQGARLQLRSDLPPGAGLGSSAALALALLRALRPALPAAALFRLALQCEELQHGHSSGLDIAVSLHGGTLFGTRGQFHPLPEGPAFAGHLYLSGIPDCTTGECVTAVSRNFPAAHPVWQEFAACTQSLLQALQQQNPAAQRQAIRQNHHLLCRIGVVPAEVADIIRQTESRGGCGKICGAGAIRGQKGGLVLLQPPLSQVPGTWTKLCDID